MARLTCLLNRWVLVERTFKILFNLARYDHMSPILYKIKVIAKLYDSLMLDLCPLHFASGKLMFDFPLECMSM